MVKWKVSLDVSYYTAEYVFSDPGDAVDFAREAMKGVWSSSTEKNKPVTVRIEAVFEDGEDE